MRPIPDPISAPAAGPLDFDRDVVPWLRQIPDILSAVEEIRGRLGATVKDYYTVEDVAELTGRAPYTVRTWIKEGRAAAVRVSGTGPRGRLLIARAELQKLVGFGLSGHVPAGIAPGQSG